MQSDLMHKTRKGIIWNFLAQSFQQSLQFIILIILARVLSPTEFGIISITYLFANFFQPFREWGFQAFLIQKQALNEEYLDTAFWAIAFVGIVLFILSLAAAPLVALFFKDHRFNAIIPVVGIGFLFSPFGSVQWALANKRMDFKSISLRNCVADLINGFFVCVFIFMGWGVWSVIIASLIRELASSVFFVIMFDWRPKFRMDRDKLREMWSFSIKCMGSGIINYFNSSSANILIGRFLGPRDLGYYSMAFNLVSSPETKLVSVITAVAFPALSTINDDQGRLRSVYMRIMKLILFIMLPLVGAIFLAAHDFVVILYGKKWLPSVPLIRIMCLYGGLQAMVAIANSFLMSKGRPDISFKQGLIRLFAFIACVLISLPYGLMGVAMGVLACSILTFPVMFYSVNRIVGVGHAEFYGTIGRYVLIFIPTVLAVWLENSCLNGCPSINSPERVIIDILFGAGTYFLVSYVFLRAELLACLDLIRKFFSHKLRTE